MDTMEDCDTYAQEQWGGVAVQDPRVVRRAVLTGARLAARPDASFPMAMHSDAEYQGLLGLLENERVDFATLATPHWEGTRRAAGERSVVLMVGDTTELDHTTYWKTMKGLGPVGNGRGRGLLLHTTLAVAPEPREVLGVAHGQVLLREPVPEGTKRRARPVEERESRVWVDAVRAIGRVPEGVRWVFVGDRGADNTRVLQTCGALGWDLVIRAAENRRLLEVPPGTPEHLFEAARSWTAQTTTTVEVAAERDQPARTATLGVSYAAVRLRQGRSTVESGLQAWVVRAWELEPPSGVAPLEWVLLTTVPVLCPADALERVAWYRVRWTVEDYHQCLKTGCQVERRDLESVERVKVLLGFVTVIAARLLHLRDLARVAPELPATTVAGPVTLRLVAAETGQDAGTMTVQQFYRSVARIGGFRGRRGDGEPGWKTLWRGWKEVQTMVHAVELAQRVGLFVGEGTTA